MTNTKDYADRNTEKIEEEQDMGLLEPDEVIEFDEALYQKNLQEHDFSEKIISGVGEEDKEAGADE